MKNKILTVGVVVLLIFIFSVYLIPNVITISLLAIIGFVLGIIIYDGWIQDTHTLWKVFPLIGRGRWLMESLRPKIQQYFVESDTDGAPIPKTHRDVVYQRSKNEVETVPFGTKNDVYAVGNEHINHSLYPTHIKDLETTRFLIGGDRCSKPYMSSLINSSAMSYGALTASAVEAIGKGAKLAGFAQNTGEGGVSPHHLKYGNDIIWQLGTGYFGARSKDGKFDPVLFKKTVKTNPSIKMIEIKLSQGAKPGHGGILPATKNTPSIAQIRGVEPGTTVHSPPYHSAFTGPEGLLNFIVNLRELAGGIPIGIKMCVGQQKETRELIKLMADRWVFPDFIAIDGSEGGTGAAPLEFTNNVGMPLIEGLVYVNKLLKEFKVREEVRLIASGKVLTGFDVIKMLALGADGVAIARGMMLGLGCIQALECNLGTCPTLIAGDKLGGQLNIEAKAKRIQSYHDNTIEAVKELIAAAGLKSSRDVNGNYIYRRVADGTIKTYEDIYYS